MSTGLKLPALMLIAMVTVPGAVHAAKDRGGETLSAEQAAASVQRQTGGRVLGAEPVQTESGPAYHVKILTKSGQVRIIEIDARTGAVRQ